MGEIRDLAKVKAEVEAEINKVIASMEMKEITSDEEYEIAGEWVKKGQATLKYIDKNLDPIRKARYAYYQEAQKAIKALKEPVQKAMAIIKAQRVKWYRKKEEERERERIALMELAESLEEKAEIAKVVEAEKTEKVSGIFHRKKYDFIIENEEKVPREYWRLNYPKIRKTVNALGNDANIPGVKVIEKIVEVVRA